jgi:tetratricopeptide (TPR) repeat protein
MLRLGCVALSVGLLTAAGCGTGSNSSSTPKSATGVSKTVDAEGHRAVVKESAIALFEEASKQAKTNPQAAIDTFKRAAKEENNFAEAWYNIGLLEQKRGNNKEAQEAYEKAIDMRPDMASSYVNMAKMLIDEGKMDEAEKLLLKVVDDQNGIAPFNVEGNLNLGMLYRRKGEAILEEERGGVEPKFSMDGAENKGEIKNKAAYDMFAKSVVYVRRALAGDSNNIYCYENLSAIYYLMNSLDVARLVCEQALIKYDEYNEALKKQLTSLMEQTLKKCAERDGHEAALSFCSEKHEYWKEVNRHDLCIDKDGNRYLLTTVFLIVENEASIDGIACIRLV